jgi:hypothetical protein
MDLKSRVMNYQCVIPSISEYGSNFALTLTIRVTDGVMRSPLLLVSGYKTRRRKRKKH